MGRVVSINVSSARGIEKDSIGEAQVVQGWGLQGDAHGGDWDRQVSIFPVEAMKKVPPEKMKEVEAGGFTENFTVAGVEPEEMAVGRTIRLGEAEVIILSIGKEEFKDHGRPYIVSREGRFGRVVNGGRVRVGDPVSIL